MEHKESLVSSIVIDDSIDWLKTSSVHVNNTQSSQSCNNYRHSYSLFLSFSIETIVVSVY